MPPTNERIASRYVRPATEQAKRAVEFFKVDPASLPDRAPVPRVRLSLPIDKKVYGVVQVHPDREPTVLGVNPSGSLDVPTGATVVVSMKDKEYLITDNTSSPKNGEGTRGVTISHGRRVSAETRYLPRMQDGVEVWARSNRYGVRTGKHEWLGDAGELAVEDVKIAYRTIHNDEVEAKTHEVRENVIYENAA